jgi:hypothetical protein
VFGAETVGATLAALVGFAGGGPIGAIEGAATTPRAHVYAAGANAHPLRWMVDYGYSGPEFRLADGPCRVRAGGSGAAAPGRQGDQGVRLG